MPKIKTDNYIYLPIGYLHLTTVKDLEEQYIWVRRKRGYTERAKKSKREEKGWKSKKWKPKAKAKAKKKDECEALNASCLVSADRKVLYLLILKKKSFQSLHFQNLDLKSKDWTCGFHKNLNKIWNDVIYFTKIFKFTFILKWCYKKLVN